MTTSSAPSAITLNAFSTESCRRLPPATTRIGFDAARRYGGGAATNSAGNATTSSLISGCDTNRPTLRSSADWPSMASNCLGTGPPNRCPRPPAAMMADTNISGTIDYRWREGREGRHALPRSRGRRMTAPGVHRSRHNPVHLVGEALGIPDPWRFERRRVDRIVHDQLHVAR